MEQKKRPDWLVDMAFIAGGLGLTAGFLWLVQRLLVLLALTPLLAMLASMGDGSEELLMTSVSPTGAHTLEVYRVNLGALEPYYIEVYRADGGREERIYDVRGEDDAEVVWMTEDVVSINRAEIDLTTGRCYRDDARNPTHFDMEVHLNAADVYGLCYEYSMGATPLGGAMVTRDPEMSRPFERGETVYIDMPQRELFQHEDKGDFGIRFSVLLADGTEDVLPEMWTWPAEYGQTYPFVLTGSAAEGYTLTAESMQCTVTQMEE